MRTGILGGTFDPIHIAHLHAGEVAMFQANLDRIVFTPAGDPWQKSEDGVIDPEHRLEMTRLAIDGIPGFELDDQEVRRDGPTYTADTLHTYPDDEELFLILGSDAAVRLPTWERWQEVVERAHVLIAPRPGTDARAARRAVPDAMALEMAGLDVSSTAIRHMAAAGEPYRFLVPAPVYDFIESIGLYSQVRPGDRVEASSDQEELP